MRKLYKLIDTAGQLTPVFTKYVPQKMQPIIASKLLRRYKSAGQVAFLEKKNTNSPIYRAQMMGDELSINGSIAAGYVLCKKAKRNKVSFYISGLNKKVKVELINGFSTITLPSTIITSIESQVVSMQGIKYVVLQGIPKTNRLTPKQKNLLDSLCRDYPATGIVYYDKDKIKPVVKVKATDSTIWETACGSGSLSYYLITGENIVRQPSGELIKIDKKNGTITISTKVREID